MLVDPGKGLLKAFGHVIHILPQRFRYPPTGIDLAGVLDESWTTAAHSGHSPGKQAKTAHFWWLQLVNWTTAGTKNSLQFGYLLEQLLVKEYLTGRVVLVMDNAWYHQSAEALAALSLFEHRVRVVWLPPTART